MKNLHELDRYRLKGANIIAHFGDIGGNDCGAFAILSPIDGAIMRVIASAGYGWEHVSVSRANRCPNWTEMSFIHRLFFQAHETAMQFHVPEADHVNCHPYCLHLWRPIAGDIPRPPAELVGPKSC